MGLFMNGFVPWVAVCQYVGLKEFYFGTVYTEHNGGDLKSETALLEARKMIEKNLAGCVPTLPKILKLIPGQIVFHPYQYSDDLNK